MKLTKKQVTRLIALAFAIAAAYGYSVSPEIRTIVSEIAAEQVIENAE